jgi:hypothetical protein
LLRIARSPKRKRDRQRGSPVGKPYIKIADELLAYRALLWHALQHPASFANYDKALLQQIVTGRMTALFILGDLRKFTEQYGDIIQWDQSNRAYIMTHGVSGIDWKHYKHPLPEHVYDVYMKYWKDIIFGPR